MMELLFKRRANSVDVINAVLGALWFSDWMGGRPTWPWWAALLLLFAISAFSVWGEQQIGEND